MTGLAWLFGSMFFVMYLFLIFTMCVMTFQKGHIVLGILGIVFPFLWLIGAVLPAKPGSVYEVRAATRYQAQVNRMTG